MIGAQGSPAVEQAMPGASALFTAEDLLRLPRGRERYELVEGRIRTMTPAGSRHGRIALIIGSRLEAHASPHDLGTVFAAETGFRIRTDPDTVRAPDVAFVARGRVDAVGDVEGYWPGPPDLAVEVLSPGDTYAEVEEKTQDWLEAGCRMVIVVDPKKRAAVICRPGGVRTIIPAEGEIDGGDVVPGWRMGLSGVW